MSTTFTAQIKQKTGLAKSTIFSMLTNGPQFRKTFDMSFNQIGSLDPDLSILTVSTINFDALSSFVYFSGGGGGLHNHSMSRKTCGDGACNNDLYLKDSLIMLIRALVCTVIQLSIFAYYRVTFFMKVNTFC